MQLTKDYDLSNTVHPWDQRGGVFLKFETKKENKGA